VKLLVIRPQPGADATVARVRAAGHEAVLMPLFEIQPVAWDVPSPETYDALLLTSGNAVRAAVEGLDMVRELPVFAVGSATARAATDCHLTVKATGETGVADLLGLAQAEGHRRLLWLAGEDRISVSVPDEMTLDTCIVYRSAAISAPNDFADQVHTTNIILLHSPRAASYFGELCDAQAVDRAGLSLAALSPAIAKSAGLGWRAIIIAPTPNDASLLSQLQSCFTNNDCDP
jgi:uroporphyrinogen-III synthase